MGMSGSKETKETNEAVDANASSSLENALRLLNLFSMDEPEWGISEIAQRLGIANSTVHRLLNTLLAEGFVAKDPRTRLYRLGSSVLALGHLVQSRLKLGQIAYPALQRLVQLSNETAHIGILKESSVIYLTKVDCSHPIRLLSHVGRRNDAHCTSTGQVLLAYLPASRQEEILGQGPFPAYTKKTITDPDKLRNLLAQVRQQGYAISMEELHDGVCSIAAPVTNHKGEVIAAVNLAGPTHRMNSAAMPRLIKLVKEAAREVSQRLSASS